MADESTPAPAPAVTAIEPAAPQELKVKRAKSDRIGAPRPAPKVSLRRIGDIPTFEVMASDLDQLEDAAGDEKNAATFCTAAGGAAIGGFLGWPTGADAARFAAHLALSVLCAVIALWFAVQWIRKSAVKKRISDRIRAAADTEEEISSG